MKLWLEKETFTAQLISEFHKSISLIRFNQMSWNMNKKHNGKKAWNRCWIYSNGGAIDAVHANKWGKNYLQEFHAKLKRVLF